jgi:antitoxin (DNA-binding transcriptional repressor) of toxin-antitoxin stability system
VNKRYTVSRVRERLSDALDEAESGVDIVIERRGRRFRLAVVDETSPQRKKRRKPRIEVLDASVADGQWTWTWTPRSLRLKPRTRR